MSSPTIDSKHDPQLLGLVFVVLVLGLGNTDWLFKGCSFRFSWCLACCLKDTSSLCWHQQLEEGLTTASMGRRGTALRRYRCRCVQLGHHLRSFHGLGGVFEQFGGLVLVRAFCELAHLAFSSQRWGHRRSQTICGIGSLDELANLEAVAQSYGMRGFCLLPTPLRPLPLQKPKRTSCQLMNCTKAAKCQQMSASAVMAGLIHVTHLIALPDGVEVLKRD